MWMFWVYFYFYFPHCSQQVTGVFFEWFSWFPPSHHRPHGEQLSACRLPPRAADRATVYLWWTARWPWCSCTPLSPRAAPSASPPAPGRPGCGPWRPPPGPQTSGTRAGRRRPAAGRRGRAWSTARRSGRTVRSRWGGAAPPGPSPAGPGRRGCCGPTPRRWRASGPPAHRCSRCPWCCCSAGTGSRTWRSGRVRPAAAARCIPTGRNDTGEGPRSSGRTGRGKTASEACLSGPLQGRTAQCQPATAQWHVENNCTMEETDEFLMQTWIKTSPAHSHMLVFKPLRSCVRPGCPGGPALQTWTRITVFDSSWKETSHSIYF